MRLALFSPFPPLASGIADYSYELLPQLARHAEVDLFIDDGYQPVKAITECYPTYGYRQFEALRHSRRYDSILYHVGNHTQFHGYIYRTLLAHPGVIVLHECVLQHLIQGLTVAQGNPQGYIDEMRYCYGLTGERLARLLINTGREVDVWAYPLFERVVDASLGVIVHSEYARQRVLASRPRSRVTVINSPFCPEVPQGKDSDRDVLREALGLPRDAFVIGCFGLITPQKRVEVSLRAFSRLRRELPNAVYVLVGGVMPHYDLESVLRTGLGEGVSLTGRLDMEAFLRYMTAADLAVNLRYPTAGETSATLIRLLGMGKPVVVSNVGSFAEYPDDCCAKVDVDDNEEDMLLATMQRLAVDESLRKEMGANARRHILTHHTPEGSAQAYMDFIQDVGASVQTPVGTNLPHEAEVEAEDELLKHLASELVGLGIREDDDPILRDLAGILVDLSVDRLCSDARPEGKCDGRRKRS